LNPSYDEKLVVLFGQSWTFRRKNWAGTAPTTGFLDKLDGIEYFGYLGMALG